MPQITGEMKMAFSAMRGELNELKNTHHIHTFLNSSVLGSSSALLCTYVELCNSEAVF